VSAVVDGVPVVTIGTPCTLDELGLGLLRLDLVRLASVRFAMQ
jgi:hypothetical protein